MTSEKTTATRTNKNDDAYRHDAVGELERKLDEAHDECTQLENALEKAVNELESTQRMRDALKKTLDAQRHSWKIYMVASLLLAGGPCFAATDSLAVGAATYAGLLAIVFGVVAAVKAGS